MSTPAPACPNCSTPVAAGNQFCVACGSWAACPNGHALASPGLKFCETCGAPAGGTAELAPARPPGARRLPLFVTAAAALVLLGGAAGFALFILLGGGGDDPKQSTQALSGRSTQPPAKTAAKTSQPAGQATTPAPVSTAASPSEVPAPTPVPAVATVPPTAPPPTPIPQAPVAPTATATTPPPTATTAPTEAACYPVTVNNPTLCIMGTGTSPKGIDLACVPPGTFVGLSTSDQRFKQWTAIGATLAAPLESTTTFKMPAGPVTVTLSCGP